MIPLTFSLADTAPRILALGAHSDDIEIGAGGTIREVLLAHPDSQVHWVVFSANGARAGEAQSSAAELLRNTKKQTIQLLDFRDGYFPYSGSGIKEAFEEIKQNSNPDVVFTHHENDRHQDHRLISELTWNTFRDHFIMEYEIPKYDGDLDQPSVFVHLSDETVNEKIRGLLAHFESQADKDWFTESTFRGLMRLRGIESRSASGYAEGFHCRKAVWRPGI